MLIIKISPIKENNLEKDLPKGHSHLSKVSPGDVEQLLRNIDSKKSTGTDKIPPKLIKLSAKVLNRRPLQFMIVSTKKCFQIMLKLHAFLPWITT